MTEPTEIAVVGAACRMPGADHLDRFATLLFAGRDAVTVVPPARWTSARFLHPAPGHAGKTYSFAAGCLDQVDDFDAAFFGISPREAASIDPQQRLMLELSHEAIEDAGLLSSRMAGSSTGVYVGASSWDFAAQAFTDVASLDTHSMQGAALSSVSNRISYQFDLRGPSFTVDTACSSALVALHLACEALRNGQIEQALVGGVNLLLAPASFVGFARASMLSRRGRCHPFDARADGYVRAEGGGAVVLKPLAQALADGDRVRAVIRATGVNSDGRTNGFSVPSRAAQAALLQTVYAEAGVEPDDLCYFEAHGTGTPVGDPIEAQAIGTALAQRRTRPLPIGSVKSNVGHLESASFMAGLMKLIVAFEHGVIPASLNFETPNPNIAFDELNLDVVARARPLEPGSAGVVAGINSFGFGGTNAHAILAAAPAVAEPDHADAPLPPVAAPLLLSARSTEALRRLAQDWRELLTEAPAAQVPALVRGAARKRDHHPHRLAITGGAPAAMAGRLATWLADAPPQDAGAGSGAGSGSGWTRAAGAGIAAGQASTGELAFVFSGNGSQWAGMAQDALALSPAFRDGVALVDRHLATALGWSVTDRLGSATLRQAMRDTNVAQPLLFAVQVATVHALRAHGVRATAHIGHSAGEVAAAWASGALDLTQACRVIVQRSLAQQTTHGAGLMAAIGLDRAAAEAVIARHGLALTVAAVNSAQAVTLAGPQDDIETIHAIAEAQGWPFARLDLQYAFHSPAMEPIRAPLLAALDGLCSTAPDTVMISTVTGAAVEAGALDARYWWRNVRAPVLFSAAADRLVARGVRVLLEIGPAPVLQSFLRDALSRGGASGAVLASLTRLPASLDPMAAIAAQCHVAGASIVAAPALDGPARTRGLPFYPWQRQPFPITRSMESVELASPVLDHPLLGFRDPHVRDAWMSHLSTASQPWLADHVLDGQVVLPAAAMIDMALAAARSRHPDADSLEIQDLEITRSLILEPGALRDCRITVAPDGQMELGSRPRLAETATVAHATGRILPGSGTTPVLRPRPDGAPGDPAAEAIEPAQVYAAAAALRLQYGPEFRTVARVLRLDRTHGLAELQPAGPDRLAQGYLLDPALVDGALQALLVLAADQPHLAALGCIVPWRFGRIRLLRASGARPRRAALHVRHIGPRSVCADIALQDETGAVVAELVDCWFAAMPFAGQTPSDQTFWTSYVPSAHQPPVVSGTEFDTAPVQTLGGPDSGTDIAPTVLLADAFAAAAAFEVLDKLAHADTRLLPPATGLTRLGQAALGWLAEDGYAHQDDAGWHLAAVTDLPESGEIWRSLFFEVPQAGAECALLAAIAPALALATRGLADQAPPTSGVPLSPALRAQILFASPAATGAMDALLRGLDAVVAAWPAGRCLRVAAAGALHAPLLRRLIDLVAVRGIPLRLVALAHDADALDGIQDLLAQTAGMVACRWDALGATERQSFDLVFGLYGLSLPAPPAAASPDAPLPGRVAPATVAGLLAPGGTLLLAEPAPSRLAGLVFDDPADARGPQAGLRAPAGWSAALRDAGLLTQCRAGSVSPPNGTLLDTALWPVALLAAHREAAAPVAEIRVVAEAGAADLVVFAAPDDPLAAALAARQGRLRQLPIEAMKDALTAPFAAKLRHVLFLSPGGAEDDGGADMLSELLADISTAMLRMPAPDVARLWLVARGSPLTSSLLAGLNGLRRVAANELPGLDCRVLCLDEELPATEAAERVAHELADPDAEREAYWRAGGRLVPRLRRHLPPAPATAGPRRLVAARPGLIGSLGWTPDTPRAPGPGEVGIAVQAAALNFRDVMWAQGLLPDEALLDGFSGPSLGLECAGIVTALGEGVTDLAIGDRVMAVAPAALATHAVTHRRGIMRMPAGLAFAAAATIPVAFMTAVYALGHLARIQPGETVLIHGGAGGVGLAAIQYAQHKGAVVYATAGSDMRRQMLRMLGVAGVFDSRSAGFVDDILAATGGEGVDVVLNSLSGELMKHSVRLLRPFGRFLEIGKRDLYRNTAIGIRPLRHNAAYFAIDTDELVGRRPAIGRAVLEEVAGLLASGRLQPLPYRAFGFAEAVDAFRLLQSSGHVGKVVLLPEPTHTHASAPPGFAASADGVYVVTGGLAGFGLETARWLGRQGAKRLALLGRRGARTQGAAEALAEFTQAGILAQAHACDVADEAALQRTLERIRRTQGPIRGVVHAAMVLDDALLPDLNAGRFAAVLRPKLAGAAALDRLTRGDALHLFLLFSSVTSVIGTPGQANYVAANAALEALAARRMAAGLPALAVQWGPVGDAGYLTRAERVSDMLAKMLGADHLRAAQALDALPGLLRSGRSVAGVADIAWGDLAGRLPGLAAPFWSEMPAGKRHDGSGQSMRARIGDMPPEQAEQAILDVLTEELGLILKLGAAAIDPARPILEFGVDSLMAVELRTALESRLGVQLPLLALTEATTLRAMAARLLPAVCSPDASGGQTLSAAILHHEDEAAAWTQPATDAPRPDGPRTGAPGEHVPSETLGALSSP